MAGTLQDFAAAVNKVVATNRDAEQGFRKASDVAKEPQLKKMFEEYSVQRSKFAYELEAAVKALGFSPTHPSGVGGMLHGAWMSVVGAFSGDNPDRAVLEETERGEDYAINAYRDALSENMPPQIRGIVEKQFEEIQQAHVRIRTLRDEHRPLPEPAGPVSPRRDADPTVPEV